MHRQTMPDGPRPSNRTAEHIRPLLARLQTSDIEVPDDRRGQRCADDDMAAALEHQRQVRAPLLAVLDQAVRP